MDSFSDQYEQNGSAIRTQADADLIARVRDFIGSGSFRPGDRLPAERHLIGELGMPRGALRRALDALEREGAIWRHVRKGTFVSRESGSGYDAIDWATDVARQITPLRMVRARL